MIEQFLFLFGVFWIFGLVCSITDQVPEVREGHKTHHNPFTYDESKPNYWFNRSVDVFVIRPVLLSVALTTAVILLARLTT